MSTQLQRDSVTSGSTWSDMVCDRIVPEDVSFLIVCECERRKASSFITNTAILGGIVCFAILLRYLF